MAIFSFAVKGSSLFAGSYEAGVFRSNDSGVSWTAVNTGIPKGRPYIMVFAVSGTNLFAGTDDGVFLTANNGANWTAVNNGLTNLTMYVDALAAADTELFAGTFGGGVFRSTDNGASWAAVNNGLTNKYVRALAVSGTNLFAGTDSGGVFFSANHGASWTDVKIGVADANIHCFAVSGTNLFAVTLGAVCDVFLTTDSGASWIAVGPPMSEEWDISLAVNGTNLFLGPYSDGIWRRPLSEMVSVEKALSQPIAAASMLQNLPNPFNPAARIPYDLGPGRAGEMKIYDIRGKMVFERAIQGTGTVPWDAAGMPSGVYVLKAVSGGRKYSRKLVLQR
jgi:hypothetical protein